MNTVSDIIRRGGGPDQIAQKAIENGVKLTADAVKKWRKNGIPEKHWPILMDLSGIDVKRLFAANNELRKGRACVPDDVQ